jgi:hypothetical protein
MPTVEKIDFKKRLKNLYMSKRRVEEVDVPAGTFLAVDGQGFSPEDNVFERVAGMLYPLAYTLKFSRKAAGGQDFTVAPLEALWPDDPQKAPMSQWHWRILMRVPDDVTERELGRVREEVKAKKGVDTSDVRLVTFEEGRCAQVLHVGPYDQVGEAYRQLAAYAQEHGLEFSGPGHDVYLSDPRRTAADRLKTVVRVPVRRRTGARAD